jgi:hypothetical protein
LKTHGQLVDVDVLAIQDRLERSLGRESSFKRRADCSGGERCFGRCNGPGPNDRVLRIEQGRLVVTRHQGELSIVYMY